MLSYRSTKCNRSCTRDWPSWGSPKTSLSTLRPLQDSPNYSHFHFQIRRLDSFLGSRLAVCKQFSVAPIRIRASQDCGAHCVSILGSSAQKRTCAGMRFHARSKSTKPFYVLSLGALRCELVHDCASAALELTRWGSGVRVPTSLPSIHCEHFRPSSGDERKNDGESA
jgi:hypothetical protein